MNSPLDQEKQRIVEEFKAKLDNQARLQKEALDGKLDGTFIEAIISDATYALDSLHAAVVREVGEWVMGYAERVYPSDVWIPLSKEKKDEVWKAIDEMMIEKFGGRIDTVSAQYARWAIKNVAQDLISTFSPNKDKEE